MNARHISVFLIMAWGLLGCSERTYQMMGTSMSPSIAPEEAVSVDLRAYRNADPSRWDVVAFRPTPVPGADVNGVWVMRVIGLPGEVIDIRDEGIYVDGSLQRLPERLSDTRYVAKLGSRSPLPISYPFQVPNGSYFVFGDNSTNALDSRFWGALPRESIIGKVRGK